MVEIPMMPSIILRVCASTMPKDESIIPCPPISPIHTEHLDIKVSTSKALAGWSMRSSTTCKHRDQGSQESEVVEHYMQWGVPVRSRYQVPPDEKWKVRHHLATQTRTYHFVMIRIRVEQPVERNDIIFNHCPLAKFGWINGKLGDGHQCSPVSESNGYRLSTFCDTVPLGSYKTFQPGWALEDSWIYASSGSGKWRWLLDPHASQLGIRPFTKTGGTWLWHDFRIYICSISHTTKNDKTV